MKNDVFAHKGGATVAAAKTAAHVEPAKSMPTIDEIVALTDTTYSAARFAPRDYDDLRAQATDAYDSGDLRKEYYPPKKVKEWRKAPQKGFDWRDRKYTADELSAWRHRAILRLMRVARLGAALGYLPEVSWENIYVFDGTTMVGCHMMKGAILALPSCVEWTDEELVQKNDKGVEFVIGYKMTVRRMLPSGNTQKTVVQCFMAEFAHLFEGDNGKEVWRLYGPDMIYAACVRRASNHAFPDRVRGMGTKEEFAVMRHAAPAKTEATPSHTPNIDSLLEDVGDEPPVDFAPPVPSTEPAQEAPMKPSRDKEAADVIRRIGEASDSTSIEQWAELRAQAESFDGTEHLAAIKKAWGENPFSPRKTAQVAS